MESQEPQTTPSPQQNTLAAWLQLFRAPNLLTVPGDPIAGFFLAAVVGLRYGAGTGPLAALAAAAVASLLLYMAGLLQNDYYDLEEDRRDRPTRPLPSGRVSPSVALGVSAILMAAGVAAGAGAGMLSDDHDWHLTASFAAALAMAILVYNRTTKHIPVVGAINMGLCRGLSLLVGAAAGGWTPTLAGPVSISAAGLTVYIAAVTYIARNETTGKPVGNARFVPPLVLLAWFGYLAWKFDPAGGDRMAWLVPGVVAVAAIMNVTSTAATLAGEASPLTVQAAIGRFIKALLLIQAALAAMVLVPGGYFAAALVGAVPLNNVLRRWFYSS